MRQCSDQRVASLFLCSLLSLFLAGCWPWPQPTTPPTLRKPNLPTEFSDHVAWQQETPASLYEIRFRDIAGQEVELKQFQNKQNVVLVVTRGYQHSNVYGKARVCIYCATQTSRFIANYEKFKERNAEVIVVFPVEQAEQSKSAQELYNPSLDPTETITFPLWIDNELLAVKHLGISADLSKPAVYLLDQSGHVRFAYVGQTDTDRPSIQAVLAKLDEINQEK